jgi:hypothetical protein
VKPQISNFDVVLVLYDSAMGDIVCTFDCGGDCFLIAAFNNSLQQTINSRLKVNKLENPAKVLIFLTE